MTERIRVHISMRPEELSELDMLRAEYGMSRGQYLESLIRADVQQAFADRKVRRLAGAMEPQD